MTLNRDHRNFDCITLRPYIDPLLVPRQPHLSLGKMMEYGIKVLHLYDELNQLTDPRAANTKHPLLNVVIPLLMMPLLQYDSMNTFFHAPLSMTQSLKNCLPYSDVDSVPSRDTAERVAAGLSRSELRSFLHHTVDAAEGTGALEAGAVDGEILGIFDGTESYSSRNKKCDSNCLTRNHKNGETEFFHKFVVLSLMLQYGHLIFDYEMLGSRDPGEKDEGEVTGFKRMCERLKEEYPRLPFTALAGDALFCNRTCINAILDLNVTGIVTLKENNRRLMRDADALFNHGCGQSTSFIGENRRKELVLVTAWYDDHFRMAGVEQDLRIVRFEEIPITSDGKIDKRTDAKGRLLRQPTTTYVVCTSTDMAISTIWKIRHYRWDVESCFHQLATYYHIDHLYSHKAAEQIFVLTLIAFNIREMYLCRFRARDFIGGKYTRKDVTQLFRLNLASNPVGNLFKGTA